MNEAYIYDAVRTPRGRGKSDGSLHDIQPVQLAQQVLEQLRDRNQLDTSLVDDVIMGCVTPIGEQGADIARTAVLARVIHSRSQVYKSTAFVLRVWRLSIWLRLISCRVNKN
jgi:acetyl-CoA acetyltransferase